MSDLDIIKKRIILIYELYQNEKYTLKEAFLNMYDEIKDLTDNEIQIIINSL